MNAMSPEGQQQLGQILAVIGLAKEDRLSVFQANVAEAGQIIRYGLATKQVVVDRLYQIAKSARYLDEFGEEAIQAALAPLGARSVQLDGGRYQRTSTNTLMAAKYPPVRAIVEDYLYEGFTVFAGRQKLGKTWLAMDWACAVCSGGYAMGSINCDTGDVLYVDLENGPRRIQGRINTLFPDERSRPDLGRLEWMTEAPSLDQGFIDHLERWRKSVRKPTLAVIDVLQRIKPAGSVARNAYENDYSAWAPLQQWATACNVAVLGLHHTKKGGADDPLEALSGSNGLSACADTTIVLDQDQNGRTLYVRGRDVEEKEAAIKFDRGNWTVLGDAAEVNKSDQRRKILDALRNTTTPLGPKEIAAATGMKDGNVRYLLTKMAEAGEIEKQGYGLYTPTHSAHTANTWGGC
ncbi:AAA family ATPase [Bradyrhizobium sp. BRP56]|uniref:AAA family ATPase n=1 Tax=Bradyrhizobium sp. BRP56 TaxID=2793819 RepID=UPI001CD70F82|nr:AAA family ATPase [Bradyrhizobium sp. BRP56]MCA1399349.1 AAA family ATPase [Bradyrhizobium sp. BRP56]